MLDCRLTLDAFAVRQPYGLSQFATIIRGLLYLIETVPRLVGSEEDINLRDEVVLPLGIRHISPSFLCLVPQVPFLAKRIERVRNLDPGLTKWGRGLLLGQNAQLGHQGNVMSPRSAIVHVLCGGNIMM